jgi:photosystem II stability/assembly factor-like uncharacterized protein
MFNLKSMNLLTSFAVFSLITMLTACSSSNDGPVFNPDVAPQNVQVVSGDDSTTAVRNTISWTLDPAATGYVVYVGNVTGVDESSSVVVPTASGFNYVTHSEANDALAGNTYYYRVQAVSGEQSSILSAEVTGTPQQSITANALNDVAWNGTDTLVAVGEAGVIINSPNGMAGAWINVPASGLNVSLKGVTWGNDSAPRFLIVGAGLTVLSGDGITDWKKEDLGNLSIIPTPDLEDVAWLGTGSGYIAVGQNGTIITSNIDGSDWTMLDSGLGAGTTLNGVASNGNVIVVVGTTGTILTSTNGGVDWSAQTFGNNSLNDITWDGNQFGVVGSNDTILTSADGVNWTSHIPGTPNITFVAASQWDSSLPVNPVLGAVGSDGTFVVSPDAVTGFRIPTGTNEQLSGITWVDDGTTLPYFVMVGNDGTVLTSQLR